MPSISFDQPLFLLGLLLLPLFGWIGSGRRSLVALDPIRRTLALILRLGIVASVVLALAGIHLVRPATATCTLFVIDASYSMSREDRQRALEYVNQATSSMRGQDKVGVVTVGADARLAFAPAEKGRVVAEVSVPDGSQTNLARGVTVALSYFPEDAARRIVLITDGNETSGSVAEAALSARADEVPIDVIPLGRQPDQEVLVERMLTPAAAKRGEPLPIRIVATSLQGGTGTLKLYRNGKYVGQEQVTLKKGKNVLSLTDKPDSPGFYTYEARLEMPGGADTVPENNRAVSFVRVQGRPRVLLVRGGTEDLAPAQAAATDRYLPEALRAQSVDVDTVSPAQIPAQLAPLLGYDGILLSDVSADTLTPSQMRTLQAAVRDAGIGLTAVGGDQAFGAGGYYQTPLEEALPVDMDVRKMRRMPGIALALAIDYSGSMGSAPQKGDGTQSKMDLAREAAHRAVDALAAQDQVGVIAVDTEATTVVPLTYATKKKDVHAGIAGIDGGAGTDMSSGVRACFAMLDNADARVKHAILITDGETAPFEYAEIIAAYKQKRMTFTLVVIDEGQSAKSLDPLKRVAKATGGRYYFVQDATQIPKIYTREVQTISKPPILEEAFQPQIAQRSSPLLSGLNLDSAPPLLGYDVTVSKPTAEVVLATHKGDPLLVTWQYGLGKSVAFTSDARSRWGAQWISWPGFGPFWAQAVRWSLRRSDTGSYQSNAEVVNGKGQITVDAVDPETGRFVNFVDARARVVGPDGSVQILPLTQTGAGRYTGAFDANKTGPYVATLIQKGPDGKTRTSSVGLAVPYSPEFAALSPNTALLSRVADLTGGRVLNSGEGVFQERRVRRLPVPLALPLLTFALLLFPLDVANRRLLVGNRLITEAAEQIQARWQARQEAQREAARLRASASVASVERLVDRKARLQAEEEDASAPAPSSRGVTWGNGAASPPPSAPRPPEKRDTAKTDSSGDYRSRLMDAKRRAARAEDDE